MPRRFTLAKFAEMTSSLHEEMKRQGFYEALGLEKLAGGSS
jgi:hypothetical protein